MFHVCLTVCFSTLLINQQKDKENMDKNVKPFPEEINAQKYAEAFTDEREKKIAYDAFIAGTKSELKDPHGGALLHVLNKGYQRGQKDLFDEIHKIIDKFDNDCRKILEVISEKDKANQSA